jgi:hypothetical protein
VEPDLKDKQGDSLYGATLRRVIAAGGRVKGMLWYQGESDANPKAAPEYSAKMEKLIAAFRQDFAQPDLPFYYVQIGRHVNYHQRRRMEPGAGGRAQARKPHSPASAWSRPSTSRSMTASTSAPRT